MRPIHSQMLTRTTRQKFFLQVREVQNIPLSSLIQVPSQSKSKYVVKNGVNEEPIRREFSLKTALDWLRMQTLNQPRDCEAHLVSENNFGGLSALGLLLDRTSVGFLASVCL